ncbi:ATP-binding protein [Thermophagus xiamenensis]|uniref:Uncharacterized protein YhaN n=1 Tax=Thermophagus xiamenensis TaxID=385682 RepID=A0A1I1WFB3_9BACT|nr:hypothetical protein [Thermophagus xiamenensis]SFD92083.1 Uncharacterized protein YhaN [Thermophagus xiamenensis]
MIKQPYIIQKLHIQKLPGLPDGLQPFESLAPNINIVAGPNASGKSSTARLIQQLIWPQRSKEIRANAFILINNEQPWEIKIDADQVMHLHNGKPDTIAGIPAKEGSHRYLLALQNMITEEESEAAETIIRESIGGYDLDGAKNNLKYSSSIISKNSGIYNKVEKAFDEYHEALSFQEKIKKEEENLSQLYKEKEEAEKARKKSEYFSLLHDYLTTQNALNEAASVLKTFHPSLTKIKGDEIKIIEDYESKIKSSEESILKAKEQLDLIYQELNQLKIPGDGLPSGTIEELENRTERISDLDKEILSLKKEIANQEIQVKETSNRLGNDISPYQWHGINLKDLDELERFMPKAINVLNQQTKLKTEIEFINQQLSQLLNPINDSDRIRNAISALNNWLTEAPKEKNRPKWLLPLLVIDGIISIVAAMVWGWPGLIGTIPLIGLWIYATIGSSPEDNLNIRKEDYLKTGLEPPVTWNNQAVINKINDLVKALFDARKYEELINKKNELNTHLRDIEFQIDEIRKVRNNLVGKLLVVPQIDEIAQNNFQSLTWLLENIKKWQDAHLKLTSLRTESEQLQSEFFHQIEECNRIFTAIGIEKAADLQQIRARLSELKMQEKRHNQLAQEAQRLETNIKYEEQHLQSKRNDLNQIYSELNIGHEDKHQIIALIHQLNDYKHWKEKYEKNKIKLEEKEIALKRHALYPILGQETLQLTPEEANFKAKEFSSKAQNWESIFKHINEIENTVKHISLGHKLEDLLAQKEKELDNLQEVYDKNLSELTGNLIVNELKEETRDQNRPQVFKGANELFNKITAGRYELRLTNEETISFSAYDTLLRKEQPLSQLSTGTRIQLLLAVKLAFIEKQETSIKLPLLVDELLANSDDERASAIINALIAISREGRQIFYFTAQEDEVRKWMAFLKEQNDVSYSFITIKNGTSPNNSPYWESLLQEKKLFHAVPPPEGKSHDQYRKYINVPPFNLLQNDITMLHLWYLTEDEDLDWLYYCLCRGIQHWGPLQSYIHNHGIIPDLKEDKWEHMVQKANLLMHFQELFSIGRSKPINREILLESGQISAKFIDAVADKLAQYNGNPKLLIEALQKGEVTGFRKAKIQDLEDFLIQNNYIDENSPLSFNDILIKLQAFISTTQITPIEAEQFLKRVIFHTKSNH